MVAENEKNTRDQGHCSKDIITEKIIKETQDDLDNETTLKLSAPNIGELQDETPSIVWAEENNPLNPYPIARSCQDYNNDTPMIAEDQRRNSHEETEYWEDSRIWESASSVWESSDNKRWEINSGTHTIPQASGKATKSVGCIGANLGISGYLSNFENESSTDSKVFKKNIEVSEVEESDNNRVNFGAGGSGLQPPMNSTIHDASSNWQPFATESEAQQPLLGKRIRNNSQRNKRKRKRRRRNISFRVNSFEDINSENTHNGREIMSYNTLNQNTTNQPGKGYGKRKGRRSNYGCKKCRKGICQRHSDNVRGNWNRPREHGNNRQNYYNNSDQFQNSSEFLPSAESSPGRRSPSPDSLQRICLNLDKNNTRKLEVRSMQMLENLTNPQESADSSPISSKYSRVWSPRQFSTLDDQSNSSSMGVEFSLDSPAIRDVSSDNSSPGRDPLPSESSEINYPPSPTLYQHNSRSPSYVPTSP